MLFNSSIFLFLFLPIVLGFFYFSTSRTLKLWVLLIGSLVFYGYWNVAFVPFLCASVLINYSVGFHIAKGGRLLWLGIAFNLLGLLYFKYSEFLYSQFSSNLSPFFMDIVLPLGISFFTFQQIAYLVDRSRNTAVKSNFVEYAVFVTFFPQLVAGPIVHQREMLKQLTSSFFGQYNVKNFNKGIFFLVMGLFKKVVIADNLAPSAKQYFSDPFSLDMLSAWVGALCYGFQLYFDFSGYCEMAIGLGLLFTLKLPINFDSPYKSYNISEFWRRWHITLGRFFRDYVYIPLGGNRNGMLQQCSLLLFVSLLSGIWHGANWVFLIWGGLHGIALVFNRINAHFKWFRIPKTLSVFLTFSFVILAWVVFNSDSLNDALLYWKAMLGLSGVPVNSIFRVEVPFLLIISYIVFFKPNTFELYDDGGNELKFKKLLPLVSVIVFFSLSSPSKFLYFNF